MPFPGTKAEMIEAGYEYVTDKVCPCGAPMQLWKTPNERVLPMNPMKDDADPAVSHFSDCPMAVQFRRAKK